MPLGRAGEAPRHEPHLDGARRIELAFEAQFAGMLLGQLDGEAPARRLGDAQSGSQHDGEGRDRRQGRIEAVEQQVAEAEGRELGAEQQHHDPDERSTRKLRPPVGHEEDRRQAAGGREQYLDAAEQREAAEKVSREHGFGKLRVHDDARHRAERGLPYVAQRETRHAEQHDLPFEAGGIVAPVEKLRRGNVADRLRRPEVRIGTGTAVRREKEVAECHTLDAVGQRHDLERAKSERHAERLEGKGRHQVALALDDERNAPHDAVEIGLRDQSAAPLLRGGDLRQVAHERAVGEEEFPRVPAPLPDHRDRARPSCRRRRSVGRQEPEDGRHHAQRVREGGFVRRQLRELVGDRRRYLRHRLDQPRRRQAVRLEKGDVDRKDARVAGRDRPHQPRHERARPRPLAELAQARLVDGDDVHGQGLGRPRAESRLDVEAAQPDLAENGRIDEAQEHDERQHRERRQASGCREAVAQACQQPCRAPPALALRDQSRARRKRC